MILTIKKRLKVLEQNILLFSLIAQKIKNLSEEPLKANLTRKELLKIEVELNEYKKKIDLEFHLLSKEINNLSFIEN